MAHQETREIAYILKGYPRLSETFIMNEIYLLEQMGVALRIFSLKGGEEQSHAIVDQIKANVTYAPKTKSVTATPFARWLATHLPKFAASHGHLFYRRPRAYLRALLFAIFGLSLQCSLQSGIRFKKSFIKEFLHAGFIAEAILAAGNVSHLHGHFCHGATTVTMLVSHMTGIPFSFTAHAKDIYLPELNPNGLLAIKLAAAEFVATCTDANRQHLEALYPGGAPIHTIYHGLDTAKFTPVDRNSHTDGRPVILSIGRFVEKKGFPYLVEACRILRDRGHSFHCRIVGQPDEQSDPVTQMIADANLGEWITIQGGVTQEELRQIYHESTIFALPCFVVDNGDRDGIPNVLAEAMATALPVVSTKISGIPEIVSDGENGLLVGQKDAIALANALERLLMNPSLRVELGDAARATIIDLFDSWQTTVALRQLFLNQLAKVQEQVAVREGIAHSTDRPAMNTVWH